MKMSFVLCLLFATGCFAELTVSTVDTAVFLREEVKIPCNYKTDASLSVVPKYNWLKVEEDESTFLIGSTGNIGTVAKANGMGITDDGSLHISEATWDIAENFTKLACEVDIPENDPQRSNVISLQVIALPDENAEVETSLPESKSGAFDIEGFPVSIGTCTGPASFPGTSITFYKNGEIIESGSVADLALVINPENFISAPDGHRQIGTKDLFIEVDKSDHRAEFICNAKIEFAGKVYYEKNKTMPLIDVKFTTDMAEWEELPTAYLDETITLKCNANGFPEPTIMINDEETSEKQIKVSSEMNGMSYTCKARNNAVMDYVESAPYTISVLSNEVPTITGDEFEDGSAVIAQGDSATFECSGSGNPPPEVNWYNDEDAKMADGATLQFDDASLDQSGTYICKSRVAGHDRLEKMASVDLQVHGVTISGEDEEVKEGKEGDKLHLDCAVNANPEPTFEWDLEDAEPTLTKTDTHMYTSQVTVGPLTSEMSQKVFTCTASNAVGKVMKKFIMPEIATAAGASTGIIIAILVIILVVAIVLAVLYNKGIICKKQEKGDESAEGDIVPAMNDEADVEAGNGKPPGPAEEEDVPAVNPEEEKLMSPEEEK